MNIYGIHPADSDLAFLHQLNIDFAQKHQSVYQYLRLTPDYQSHNDSIELLKKIDSGSIFFFCHALDRSIRGCNCQISEFKEFRYGPFVSPERNIEIFKGKSVFALACFSEKLGYAAIDAGATVYLGFGNIPLYNEHNSDKTTEKLLKDELTDILCAAINFSIENNTTFNQLSNNLNLLFERKRYNLLSCHGHVRQRNIQVSNALSIIKNGMKMFGNGDIKILV